MSIKVVRPGLLSTVQDRGRFGMQRFGVPVGGAMDLHALALANSLVGNAQDAAALEITLAGPVLQFADDTLISLCGADLNASVNELPVPMNRPVWVARGVQLAFGKCVAGCRTYLGLSGGIDVPTVLGSRSTYIRASLGGFRGRALRAGDQLFLLTPDCVPCMDLRQSPRLALRGFATTTWSAQTHAARQQLQPPAVRFVAGRHWGWLPPEARGVFLNETYRVGTASDRMGYRLDGVALAVENAGTVSSEAVAFGTIQLPPDGKPIVLMADRQTIGGYPRLGEVVSVDLPLLAQLKPGDTLTFDRISLADAQQLVHDQEMAQRNQEESVRARLFAGG